MSLKVAIRRKIFPARDGAPSKLLFDDFALALDAGEAIALAGPSGVGKTSLLQIIAGLDRNFDGSVSGRPGRIGYLFQSPRLLPWRTAQQNVELVTGGAASGWLARVGLGGAADLYPHQLSLGMARRVALARALAIQPELLLLDEPFSALDKETALEMRRLIASECARLRPAMIMVTHDVSEAAGLASRIVTLGGTPAQILEEHSLGMAAE
jgi:ABC-type nitrate/sulfonate/bicarbonate transport system ATPase subunit